MLRYVKKLGPRYRSGRIFMVICLLLGGVALTVSKFGTDLPDSKVGDIIDQAWTGWRPSHQSPLASFVKPIFESIESAKPKFAISIKSERKFGSSGIILADTKASYDGEPLTESYLSQSLVVEKELLDDLKLSHAHVVSLLPTKIPETFYKGDGIIYVGGGTYSWLSLLSLKSLRKTGSVLPVEVIIPTSGDYEQNFCEKILPQYNAKCVLLPDVLGAETVKSLQFKGFQLKSLALLASSFQNVLLLDSDNIPINNPDYVFESKVFKDYGMIVWPDYWARVTHPGYYQVAGLPLANDRVRLGPDHISTTSRLPQVDLDHLPLHDRQGSLPDPSSESGQMFLNKVTHHQVMWLSLYYNSYGPDSYYPLFSQSSFGEGDKETFIAAAHYYNMTFYQVNKKPEVIGHHGADQYYGVGMIQYDPMQDFNNQGYYMEQESVAAPYDPKKFDTTFLVKNSRYMFVHANYPKLDPTDLLFSGYLNERLGKRIRMYGDQNALDFDFELVQWKNIKELICEEAVDMKFISERGSGDADSFRIQMCEKIDDQLKWLEGEGLQQLEVAKSHDVVS